MTIHPLYESFCMKLSANNIEWCFIKDFNFLLRKKYDNEIDLVALSSNRKKIRSIAKQLGWRESTHNSFNTHLIFWKFEKKKPFRIDVHLDKVLATAMPKIKAQDILNTRKKKGNLFSASEVYELAVLFLSGARGREEVKPYRVKRANTLKKYKKEVKSLLKVKLFDFYFEKLLKGEVFRLGTLVRLGISGILKFHYIRFLLLINRIFHPSPIIKVNYKDKKEVLNKLKSSKLKISFKPSFKSRLIHDFVFVKDTKGISLNSLEFYKKISTFTSCNLYFNNHIFHIFGKFRTRK